MNTQQQVKNFIESTTKEHQIVVFAKSWCPYCDRTKALLESSAFDKVDVEVHDIDVMMPDGGHTIQRELQKMTGQRTVPSVWVNGKFLGGNDETQRAWASGQLSSALQ